MDIDVTKSTEYHTAKEKLVEIVQTTTEAAIASQLLHPVAHVIIMLAITDRSCESIFWYFSQEYSAMERFRYGGVYLLIEKTLRTSIDSSLPGDPEFLNPSRA